MAQDAREYYRFCPGQERIKISDAVCMGRRRAAYPKCKGCQFNDDERAQRRRAEREAHGELSTQEHRQMLQEKIAKVFKAYDVRATYPDPLNEEIAWRLGYATAQFLRSQLSGTDRADREANTLAVGRDMRLSSEALQTAFMEGALATGADVIDIGLIDTPQAYFAANRFRCCGAVQTTASHNPAEYNGFKFCGQGGKAIGQGSGLEEIKQLALSVPKHESGQRGQLRQEDLAEPYKQFVRQFLKPIRPMKVVVDASNGVGGKWFPLVFGDVEGLEIVGLNFEMTGEFVHDPNPLISANLRQLRKAVREHKADWGVCFDGDADRLMVVDEKAEIIPCDYVTALLARMFLAEDPGSVIVYDLRSSWVVREEIEKAGGVPKRQRVGHAFMKRIMAESDAVFGGELSGHFYFRENWYCDSGLLAFVHVLNLLTAEGKPLSRLVKPLKRYHASGERNFVNDKQDETIQALAEKYADGKVDFLDGVTVEYSDWWFNVRKSNTEPLLRLNLEAKTAKLLREKLAELTPLLGEPAEH